MMQGDDSRNNGTNTGPGFPPVEHQFKPGNAGRPKGARNKTTLAIEALLESDAETITRKAIELAKSGDLTAIRLCMDRLCPPRKDRYVEFELPEIGTAADTASASAAIVRAVAASELTPSEAVELAKVLEGYTRCLEASDFERRLAALEGAKR